MSYAHAVSDSESTCPANDSFETLMERLEALVKELEHGDVPLERAVLLFEEGVRLSRLGGEKLERAEARIEELLAVTREAKNAAKENRGKREG